MILAVHVADALADEAAAPLDDSSGVGHRLDRHALETLVTAEATVVAVGPPPAVAGCNVTWT